MLGLKSTEKTKVDHFRCIQLKNQSSEAQFYENAKTELNVLNNLFYNEMLSALTFPFPQDILRVHHSDQRFIVNTKQHKSFLGLKLVQLVGQLDQLMLV